MARAEKYTHAMTLRLEPATHEALRELAQRHDTDVAHEIRLAITMHLGRCVIDERREQ